MRKKLIISLCTIFVIITLFLITTKEKAIPFSWDNLIEANQLFIDRGKPKLVLERLKDFVNKRISIQGYMIITEPQEKHDDFLLTNSILNCFFCDGEFIPVVRVLLEKSQDYDRGLKQFEGVLVTDSIEEEEEADSIEEEEEYMYPTRPSFTLINAKAVKVDFRGKDNEASSDFDDGAIDEPTDPHLIMEEGEGNDDNVNIEFEDEIIDESIEFIEEEEIDDNESIKPEDEAIDKPIEQNLEKEVEKKNDNASAKPNGEIVDRPVEQGIEKKRKRKGWKHK